MGFYAVAFSLLSDFNCMSDRLHCRLCTSYVGVVLSLLIRVRAAVLNFFPSLAVHSRSGEELSVRTVTLPGWACTSTSHALQREAWPLPIRCFPVIWQKWGTSFFPDLSQEFGPCRSLCAILIPRDMLCILKTQTWWRVAMMDVDSLLFGL